MSDTTPPPQTQEEWLRICRDELLFPDQYAALRGFLGLPAEEPQEPPGPPTDPGTPPVPEGLLEILEHWSLVVTTMRNDLNDLAGEIDAALAELGGGE